MTRHSFLPSATPALIALALCACTGGSAGAGHDAARVDCGTPGPHGVDCEIRRTGGDGSFEACWDLAIACRNGGSMRASTCSTMAAAGQQGTRNMPAAAFSGQDSCDVPVSGQVEQLKITSR